MRLFYLFIFSIICSFSASAQDFERGGEFNNLIVNEQNKISVKNFEYVSFSVHSENYRAIEKKRIAVIEQLKSSYGVIKGANYEGGEKLKEEALEVIKLYMDAFQVDFSDALSKRQNSQSSFEAMEEYHKAQDLAEKKLNQASKKLNKAQKAFADKEGVELIQSEKGSQFSKSLEMIGALNKYSRSIYLQEFKVSKINAAFMDMVQAENSKGIENKRIAVIRAADEALQAIQEIGDFKGDASYKEAALEAVMTYKKLADNEYKAFVKVIKLDQKDLTKEDVDAFNNGITVLNQSMQELTKNINTASQKLMQKFIPNLSGSGQVTDL